METTVALDVEFVSLLIGTVIPLLVGLLTKLNASSGVKAVVNALLAALAGFLTEAGSDEFVLGSAIVTVLLTWAVSVATYYGLYKPTGTSQAVQRSTRNFGVGSSSQTPPPHTSSSSSSPERGKRL